MLNSCVYYTCRLSTNKNEFLYQNYTKIPVVHNTYYYEGVLRLSYCREPNTSCQEPIFQTTLSLQDTSWTCHFLPFVPPVAL